MFILSYFWVYLLLEERVIFQVRVPVVIVVIAPTVGLGCLFDGWFLGWCSSFAESGRVQAPIVLTGPLCAGIPHLVLVCLCACCSETRTCWSSVRSLLGVYRGGDVPWNGAWAVRNHRHPALASAFWQDIKLVVPKHGRARWTLLEIHEAVLEGRKTKCWPRSLCLCIIFSCKSVSIFFKTEKIEKRKMI